MYLRIIAVIRFGVLFRVACFVEDGFSAGVVFMVIGWSFIFSIFGVFFIGLGRFMWVVWCGFLCWVSRF